MDPVLKPWPATAGPGRPLTASGCLLRHRGLPQSIAPTASGRQCQTGTTCCGSTSATSGRRVPDVASGRCPRPSVAGTAAVPGRLLRGAAVVCEARRDDEGRVEAAAIQWAPVSVCLFAAGATLGPLLDGIHGTVQLLDYEAARIDIGGLHSSLWVPLLLGTFYAVLGGLTNIGDVLAEDKATDAALTRCRSGAYVALSVGAVALLLEVSAVMYKSGSPYSSIALVLAPLGLANWALLDRTRQGLGLCVLCAVAAPVSELFIVNYLGWWHYNAPDLFGAGGLPSWVPWCYFFYTPSVVNLARWLNYRFSQ